MTESSSRREEIDKIRLKFELLPNKTPDNHEVSLDFRVLQQVELAVLTIKSGSKNALSGKMISQLTQHLDEIEKWASQEVCENDARCLLIMGDQGTFCAGSDLVTVRETFDESMSDGLAKLMQYNFRRIARLPVISVSYVEGYALGGGAEIAIAVDLMIMSDTAKIGFVHARNGICCGWGGGLRLVQMIGRTRALELLSSGRLVDAEEARRLGLACKLPELEGEENSDKEIPKQVLNFCASHAITSRHTTRAVKSLVEGACELPTEQALLAERQLFVSTWGKAPHLNALGKNLKHNK